MRRQFRSIFLIGLSALGVPTHAFGASHFTSCILVVRQPAAGEPSLISACDGVKLELPYLTHENSQRGIHELNPDRIRLTFERAVNPEGEKTCRATRVKESTIVSCVHREAKEEAL